MVYLKLSIAAALLIMAMSAPASQSDTPRTSIQLSYTIR